MPRLAQVLALSTFAAIGCGREAETPPPPPTLDDASPSPPPDAAFATPPPGPSTAAPRRLDAAALAAAPRSFDGARVEFAGQLQAREFEFDPRTGTLAGISGPLCTTALCPPDNPCCNHCSSPPSLWSGLIGVKLVATDGSTYGCQSGGLQCETICNPPLGLYRAIGTLHLPSRDGPLELHVERLRRL